MNKQIKRMFKSVELAVELADNQQSLVVPSDPLRFVGV